MTGTPKRTLFAVGGGLRKKRARHFSKNLPNDCPLTVSIIMKNRFLSKVVTFIFKEKEYSILMICRDLLRDNFEQFRWMIDNNNVKNKTFLDKTQSLFNIEFLSKLNYGTVQNLKKIGKRCLSYVDDINDLLSRMNSQNFLMTAIEEINLKKLKMQEQTEENTSEKDGKITTNFYFLILIISLRIPCFSAIS